MNLHSFSDGLVLGLLAMTGVFLILAIIGLILYAFELIFYRSKKSEREVHREISNKIISESGIPKSVVAAISAAVYTYLGKRSLSDNISVKIKRHKKLNKAYEKLKLERWRNG